MTLRIPAASLVPDDVVRFDPAQMRGTLARPGLDVDRAIRQPGGLTCAIWWHDHLHPAVVGVTVLGCTSLVAVVGGPHAKAAHA